MIEGNSFPLQLKQTHYGPVLNRIQLPKADLIKNEYRGMSKTVYFEYKNLQDLLMPAEKFIKDMQDLDVYVLNSRIVSASLGQGRHIQLAEKVQLTFQHLAPNLTNPICVFWNFELSGWSDSGCNVVATNASTTVCECDHLTNFALLMKSKADGSDHDSSASSITSTKLSPTTVLVLEIVTYVAVALSIIFVFIILYKVTFWSISCSFHLVMCRK